MTFSEFKKSAESVLIDLLAKHEVLIVTTINGNVFRVTEVIFE